MLLCFLLAGTAPPNVNESHYLAKAKHYWNPTWCAGDLFLESADAHWTFYWTFGWLTQFMSLTAVAWVGRLLSWIMLAWSWRRLSHVIIPRRMFAVVSAAIFVALVEWGHMAGEWVVGGIEAKGFAFPFVFWALESLVRQRWRRAAILCGAAASFHVLVGGWALVAIAMAWLFSSRSHRPPLLTLFPALILAVLISLPGVVPALALNSTADPEIIREANQIYVFERLDHHLVFHRLPFGFIARHAALMVAFPVLWKLLSRGRRNEVIVGPFPRFVASGMLIALIGAVSDQLLLGHPQLAAAVLRYYWFRLSDVMTPLGVTFALLIWQQQVLTVRPGAAKKFLAAVVLLVSVNVAHTVIKNYLDPRPGAVVQAYPARYLPVSERLSRWQEWLQLCQWVSEHTQPTDLFLTPRHQQTFKWDTGRPEVVNGKDIPQDAEGIVAWRGRMDEIFPYTVGFANLRAHGERRLTELSRKYGFRYIVLDRRVSAWPLRFPRIYPESSETASSYEVYRVPGVD